MTPALLHSLRQILGPMTSERKCREVVRVVLEHYREPPEELWNDGAPLDPDVIGYDCDPQTYWTAIINAALSELSQPAGEEA